MLRPPLDYLLDQLRRVYERLDRVDTAMLAAAVANCACGLCLMHRLPCCNAVSCKPDNAVCSDISPTPAGNPAPNRNPHKYTALAAVGCRIFRIGRKLCCCARRCASSSEGYRARRSRDDVGNPGPWIASGTPMWRSRRWIATIALAWGPPPSQSASFTCGRLCHCAVASQNCATYPKPVPPRSQGSALGNNANVS